MERSRFLRHVRPYWEVHRHRSAPQPSAAIRGAIDEGRLSVSAGRITRFLEDETGVDVLFRPRGSARTTAVRVERVVNCTGPAADLRQVREPLMEDLYARGLARRDPLSLGLETADDFALLDAHHKPSKVLYMVGPMLKGKYWEATAVPELRVHAARVAEIIANDLR